MKDKVKVLFIVSEFYQAGAQRFTYELDRAIDKNHFEVNILSLLPLGHNANWEDHYFTKHVELGTKVFFLSDIDKPFIPDWSQRIKKKLLNVPFPDRYEALNTFLDAYDVLYFVGEYNYPELEGKMTPAVRAKCLINIHNSIIQNPANYARYDKSQTYHFVSGFRENEIKSELSVFENFHHTFLPLSINLDDHGKLWSFHDTDKPRIGIFTRLTFSKPIDPFIYTFHILLERLPGAELHIFGNGDPEKEGISKYIRHLGLTGKVKFHGHQKDMKATAMKEKLNLVWFHGYYGIPGGFAGFDICSIGLPQLFWDFSHSDAGVDTEFPMYNNIVAFADRTVRVLQDAQEAEKLSLAQYQYIQEYKNIQRWVGSLEKLFRSFKQH